MPILQLPRGSTLRVALRWDADTAVAVGRLGMRGRFCLFEYDRDFLAHGPEISPLRLPRQPGVVETREPMFEHLPGVFRRPRAALPTLCKVVGRAGATGW